MNRLVQKGRQGARVVALFAVVCLAQSCSLIARRGTIAYMAVTTGSKDIEIRLNQSFIERFKNRVTIDAIVTVDRVMPEPVPALLDGDLHFSGRSRQIQLPVVGEIANAALHKDAMDIAHRFGGSGKPLSVSGVWRIWPEHSGSKTETQGKPLDAYSMANPDHVFEIHPITRLNDLGLLDSFIPVEGFKPGDDNRTIAIYEKATCTLKAERETVAIVTQQGLYNDVEFTMEIADNEPQIVEDGRFVNAVARDRKGALLAPHVRMVFAKGTPPELAVRNLKRGARLRVFGIPRLNLAEISRRVQASATDPAAVAGPLPYEIIIIGVFPK
jgi:hypothetical protein